MALIKCPECGRKKVSDTAEACPKCGFGVKAYFEAMRQVEQGEKESPEGKEVEAEHPSSEERQASDIQFWQGRKRLVRGKAVLDTVRKVDKRYVLIGIVALLIAVCGILIYRANFSTPKAFKVSIYMTNDEVRNMLGTPIDTVEDEYGALTETYKAKWLGYDGSFTISYYITDSMVREWWWKMDGSAFTSAEEKNKISKRAIDILTGKYGKPEVHDNGRLEYKWVVGNWQDNGGVNYTIGYEWKVGYGLSLYYGKV